jgi:hypothetical protein
MAADLAFEQAGDGAHASVKVVMVMVWLCSSHRAVGTQGEISP